MKIYPERLPEALSKPPLAPVYLITGDESFLVHEACVLIREQAKAQAFSERQSWMIETGFPWEKLYEATQSLSLFAEKELIELHFKAMPNDVAKKALTFYLENQPDNKTLLITLPKLDSRRQSDAWIKLIDQCGLIITVWPLSPQQLPHWIKTRFKKLNMKVTDEAAQFIAHFAEGNLLAAQQEIEKLSLLYDEKPSLTLTDVTGALSDQARFDLFILTDYALSGNAAQTLRIIKNLIEEGTEETLILWAFTREIRLLLKMIDATEQGHSVLEKFFQKQRLWEKRKVLLQSALKRHSKKTLHALLKRSGDIDRTIKGIQGGNPIDELIILGVGLAQPTR